MSESGNNCLEHDIEKIVCDLSFKLPYLLSACKVQDKISIQKFSAHESRMVQRSLLINTSDSSFKVFIHGALLPGDHEIYAHLPLLNFKRMSHEAVLRALIQAVSEIRLFDVCCGVSKVKYQELRKKTEGCIEDGNIFKETRFEKTCRAVKCKKIVTLLNPNESAPSVLN